jgi:SWI/SNF-related matrix-associated actin-dependent regulator 1 of chromatin subfamily A
MDLTEEPSDSGETKPRKKAQKKGKAIARKEKQYVENSANVLMDLRKAASHPMLFRCLFTDETVSSIARVLLKESEFKSRGAVFQYVREDLEVMTDSELQVYMASYKVGNLLSIFEAFYILMLISSRRKSSFRIRSVTSGQGKLRHF